VSGGALSLSKVVKPLPLNIIKNSLISLKTDENIESGFLYLVMIYFLLMDKPAPTLLIADFAAAPPPESYFQQPSTNLNGFSVM
jgi:hypothetical protein